jgi:hypothetical protein
MFENQLSDGTGRPCGSFMMPKTTFALFKDSPASFDQMRSVEHSVPEDSLLVAGCWISGVVQSRSA